MQDIIASLPAVFLTALLLSCIFYWIGGRIAPQGKKTPDKLSTYACGEEYSPNRLQLNVQNLFIYAVYFLIFDIIAFVLATSFTNPGLMPALYALITMSGVVFLFPLLETD
ncbi:MAG: NADH-quinone oxidoreductase subunit A [archaeon]